MYRIAKRFRFCASHILHGLGDAHPCSRLHGHNYEVQLLLAAEALDASGFVVDYNALQRFRDLLSERYDHRHLNDVVDFQPSAELLARHFFDLARELWPQLRAVRVAETPDSWAEYSAGSRTHEVP